MHYRAGAATYPVSTASLGSKLTFLTPARARRGQAPNVQRKTVRPPLQTVLHSAAKQDFGHTARLLTHFNTINVSVFLRKLKIFVNPTYIKII